MQLKQMFFFSKLTSKGDLVWAKKISGTDAVLAAGLGLDNFNNLYVSGTFAPDILDLNPDNEVFNVATTQTFNSFLIKMSQQTIDESNIDIASNFKVVPKKNSKDYHIKISEKLIGATANIYDYLGKPIEKFSLTSLQTSKELAKGLYTVEIEFAGKSSSKKITIN